MILFAAREVGEHRRPRPTALLVLFTIGLGSIAATGSIVCLCAALQKHGLCLVPRQPVDDGNMVVVHIILGHLAVVAGCLMGQEVLGDVLLVLTVTHILLIAEDVQHRICPPDAALDRSLAHRIQLLCDGVGRCPADKAVEDVSHNLCLLRVDEPLAVRPLVVTQHPAQVHHRFAALELALDGPADVVGNRPGFILRQCGKDGQDQLACGVKGVDVLLFKIDAHGRIKLPELSDAVQSVDGVAGKARDGFRHDVVHLATQRRLHHFIELLALGTGGAGNRFVCVDSGHRPAGLAGDQLGVESLLGGVGGLLTFVSGGDTAVCRNPEVPLLLDLTAALHRAYRCRNHVDFRSSRCLRILHCLFHLYHLFHINLSFCGVIPL